MIFEQANAFDFLPTIEPQSISLVVLDMPFGTTQAAWDVRPDLDKLFAALWRVAKEAAPIVAFASQPFTTDLVAAQRKQFRYEWIWEKSSGSNFLSCKKQPLKTHESILVFCRQQPHYYPQMTKGEPYTQTSGSKSSLYGAYTKAVTQNKGERYPRSVVKFNNARNIIRATQKPLDLIEYLIKTYTTEGQTVLDPFAGSATTAIACLNTGRNFVGCELDPTTYQKAKARIEKAGHK